LLSVAGRQQVSNDEHAWETLYRNNVTALGKLKTREFVGTNAVESPPNNPPGFYRIYTYRSAYTKKTMIETVIVRAEGPDWKPYSYLIGQQPPSP